MPSKNFSKKNLLFNSKHEVKYGLKVTAREAGSSNVSSVACQFCIAFGKEEAVGRKRKATANVKYFESFRTDSYETHLNQQHCYGFP